MKDGYITSKQLSGKEGLTGVAAREAEQEDREFDKVILEMAAEILKEKKEKKESNIKKEKKEKKTVANS
jgi:hypothetical protein|tara:strand:- start:256 stop:462 length:207 start_codon:yes stop_codon:yes gene_type:complete